METKYVFIIDTNQFSSPFDSEMCAYLTGIIGECKVGKKEASKFEEKFGKEKVKEMEEIVEKRADEYGCYRPTATCEILWSLFPAGGPRSVGIFFNDKPPIDIINMMKKRAGKFCYELNKSRIQNDQIKILGFRLRKETLTEEEIKI